MILTGKLKYPENNLSQYYFVLRKTHTAYSGIDVGFLVDRVALGQAFLLVLQLTLWL